MRNAAGRTGFVQVVCLVGLVVPGSGLSKTLPAGPAAPGAGPARAPARTREPSAGVWGVLPRSATYRVYGAGEGTRPPVERFTLTILGTEVRGDRRFVWWQLDVPRGVGKSFAIRGLSERAPMTSVRGPGQFERYLLRSPQGQVLEYRDARTGRAALPQFDLQEDLLPNPSWGAAFVDGFAAAGTFLGHMAILDDPQAPTPDVAWPEPKVLELRCDLLIGTGRNTRDDGTGPDETGEYRYVPFQAKDYAEMIAAGINYFGVKDEQLRWVRDEPVFWRGPVSYPVDLYRSNFAGVTMFSDEPAVRLGWQGLAPERLFHPHQAASMLMTRVAWIYARQNRWVDGLARRLRQQASLGIMDLPQRLVPTWETEYQTAFYELAGGAPGIVHEGRYVEDGYGWHPDRLFGPGLKMSPRQMLLCYYAFLRGAARAFGGFWGMSIYGQSDPKIRLEAMTLAYEMGARCIWFWTSDHDHHVPYREQLRLARELTAYAAEHPRASLEELRNRAKVAIAFPMGYTLSWGLMWGQRAFEHERPNRAGVSYRDVVAAAMWEGVLCAKRGIPFDFTVEHENLANLGYERILHVGEDARVYVDPPLLRSQPRRFELSARLGRAGSIRIPEPVRPASAMPVYGRRLRIDGDLADWDGAEWIVFNERPYVAGRWDGPKDLSARVAFAYDECWFYVAAEVLDDVQCQPKTGWHIFEGDSIQVALDPLNLRNAKFYLDEQHEFGLALENDRPVCFRWHGRRSQLIDRIPQAQVAIERHEDEARTVYEAALPLAVLSPLAPEIVPQAGYGVVINDNDGAGRETIYESAPGAMSEEKRPVEFPSLLFVRATDRARQAVAGPRCWAAITWPQNVFRQGEPIPFELYTAAWEPGTVRLEIALRAEDPLSACTAVSRLDVPLQPEPRRRTVEVLARTPPPGRYRLRVVVRDSRGAALADENAPVFVYP